MIEAIKFMVFAWKAYKRAGGINAPIYSAITKNGVPTVAIFVGIDRSAWWISQLAIEFATEYSRTDWGEDSGG